jgi:hypothetical protein
MKTLILKILGFMFIFTSVLSCSSNDDDNDSPPVVNDIMIVYNRETGVFYSLNKIDGSLSSLGSFTINGQPLTGLRDVVYNPGNATLYASSNANNPSNGKIYSIDPLTLEAAVINDNADDDWYAIPGIEILNNKILGTVYWDEYDWQAYSGLVWLNLDGSIFDIKYFDYDGDNVDYFNICCGMGLEFGTSQNEILMSYEDRIVISDLSGNVSQIIELTESGFPIGVVLNYVRCIEKDANGILYALDEDGVFGSINLDTGNFNYIATLTPEGGNWLALSKIPDNIFP